MDDDHVLHPTHVKHSLEELQQQVKEHEAALSQLRASAAASRHRHAPSPTASLEVMKTAYEDLTEAIPFLPYQDSVLPALIALRKTHQTVEDTKVYLASHRDSVDKAKRHLESEQAALKDQESLKQCLDERIQSLRDTLENQMDMGPEQVARERIGHLKQRTKNFDSETSKLLKLLRKFIEDNLGSMLAAEELGGPVVGDMMDIDGDSLAAGFNTQGRLKKAKDNPDQGKRQRRIDEIWGQPQDDSPGKNKGNRDEAESAAAEMRRLTEELLNSLSEADGDISSSYVKLPRETAAARFLVRSKVAKFHPKDSTRLRLIDFGRDVDA